MSRDARCWAPALVTIAFLREDVRGGDRVRVSGGRSVVSGCLLQTLSWEMQARFPGKGLRFLPVLRGPDCSDHVLRSAAPLVICAWRR